MPRYPHAFGGGSAAVSPPTGLDRLQQLQDLDTADAHSNALQQQSLAHMLTSLYGIKHEQQFAPEQLRALSSSTNARDFETERASAMLPEQLRGARAENASREFGNQWAQPNAESEDALRRAQIERLTADTGEMKRPKLAEFLPFILGGQMKMEDVAPSMGAPGESYMSRLHTQNAAKAKEIHDIEHPPAAVIPPELQSSIPSQYANDPNIVKSLADLAAQQKGSSPTDPGLIDARRAAEMQVHPFAQFMRDMLNPSNMPYFRHLSDPNYNLLGRLKSSTPAYAGPQVPRPSYSTNPDQ